MKVQQAYKLPFGARRENITALAVANAAGVALDPLIIFKGKNLMESWFGENALPNTYYGKSDKGWMDAPAFLKWFETFVKDIKERPLLLIFDGHMIHVTILVIALAMKENIILVKLPPHCTDLSQVLDKTCFSSLKKSWENLLAERANKYGVNSSLSRSEFVNLLCSIWKKGLSKENIVKGFETTGTYPLNREKYPVSRFDPRLLQKYNEWKDSGATELNWGNLKDDIEIAQKNVVEENISTLNETVDHIIVGEKPPEQSSTPTSKEPIQLNEFSILKKHIGNYPYKAPDGFKWIPNGWKLVEDTPQSCSKSFEEIFLDKIKGIHLFKTLSSV